MEKEKTKSEVIREYLLKLKEAGEDISILPKQKALQIAGELGVSESLVYKVKKELIRELKKSEGGIDIIPAEKPSIPSIEYNIEGIETQVYSESELAEAIKQIFQIINSFVKQTIDVEVYDDKLDELSKSLARILAKRVTVQSDTVDALIVLSILIYMYSPVIMYLYEKHFKGEKKDDNSNQAGSSDEHSEEDNR